MDPRQLEERFRALPSDELARVAVSADYTPEARAVARAMLLERGAPVPSAEAPLVHAPRARLVPRRYVALFVFAVVISTIRIFGSWKFKSAETKQFENIVRQADEQIELVRSAPDAQQLKATLELSKPRPVVDAGR